MSEVPPSTAPPAPNRKSPLKRVLLGCLVVTLLGFILAGIAGYWVFKHGKDAMADIGRNAIVSAVEEADVEATQKTEIISQIDRVTTAFKEDQINLERMGRLAETITQSGPFLALISYGPEQALLRQSDLTSEERQAASLALHRFRRGTVEGKISQQLANDVLELAFEDGQINENFNLKNELTEAELQAFLEAAKAAADESDISERYEPIDFASPIKQIIDDALGERRSTL